MSFLFREGSLFSVFRKLTFLILPGSFSKISARWICFSISYLSLRYWNRRFLFPMPAAHHAVGVRHPGAGRRQIGGKRGRHRDLRECQRRFHRVRLVRHHDQLLNSRCLRPPFSHTVDAVMCFVCCIHGLYQVFQLFHLAAFGFEHTLVERFHFLQRIERVSYL